MENKYKQTTKYRGFIYPDYMSVHTEKLSGSAISIQQQAFTLSIHDVFIIATVIAIFGLPFSFYLKAKKNNCNNIGG